MPIGVNDTLDTLSGQNHVSDPATFDGSTEPNATPIATQTYVDGQPLRVNIPNVGLVSSVSVTFHGSITIAAGGTILTDRWPHGLVSRAYVSVNGQDKLFAVDGEDLHVRRFAANPAYAEAVDLFPGTLGGGNINAGTYELDLSWEIPIAMDPVTLVGSLYAQSAANQIALEITPATLSQLVVAPNQVSALSGVWTVNTETYKIPVDGKGQLIVPDLSRLHGFVSLDIPFSNTGEVTAPLIRSAGQLCRLFVSLRKGYNQPLSARPVTAAASRLEALRIEYGGNERPLNYDPANRLLRRNNKHYGGILPYNRLCIDLVRENPRRDALILTGVTELKTVVEMNGAVTPGSGAALHLVQETLY